jgi:bacterioferritin-associated ferredoxin
MPNHPLFAPIREAVKPADLHNQVQIALAIADPAILKSLLVQCLPPIVQPQQIGRVAVNVAVPLGEGRAADGVLEFEAIQCVLSEPPPLAEGNWRERSRFTQYESELHTLGQNLALAPLVSLLAGSGFCPKQIEEILHLPQDCWHKSWWLAIDAQGDFSQPFLRQIRLLRYVDGSFTLQYKDYFEQSKPPCFTSQLQQVLIAIKPDSQSFSETLRQINEQRSRLQIPQTVLICHTLSDLEAQGFIHQGVSIYSAAEVVLPIQANCLHCGRHECPMNAIAASPIVLCHGYLPETELV